ncbi:MAG TPA: ABC transporter substrate-binding protein, partial [Thermomicrobiaceae bacterium]|nr:ABC transporter substrate-binding protein [Thermomicrobiaceae bacterium]
MNDGASLPQRRMSRRRLFSGAAFLGLGAISGSLLASCGGNSSSPTSAASTQAASQGGSGATTAASSNSTPASASSATGQSNSGESPKKGGTWSLALLADGVPYPITLPNALPSLLTCKTIFNDLTKFALNDKTIEVVPDLAESWQANDTLTEYTFKLRQDVKWHDGKPFTSDDVKFTVDSMLDPNVNGAQAGNISAIKETQAVDPNTVKFILKYPYSDLPTMLGYNQYVCPKHLLDGQDLNNPADFLKHPVGTGPFMFKDMQHGSYVEAVANPNYFGDKPYLDSVVYKV